MHDDPGRAPVAPATEVLCTLAAALGRAESPAAMYDAALDALRDAVGVERSSILLFDTDGVMRFKAWRGLSDNYRAAVEGHSPWRADAPSPSPIAVSDVRADGSLQPFLTTVLDEGIGAMLFIPLTARGRVIGKFMCYAAAPRTFSPAEIALASAVAQQVAFTVARAATETECARLTAQAEFLADFTSQLNRTLDYGETLHILTELAVPRISDICLVHMVDAGGVVRPSAVGHADRRAAAELRACLERAVFDQGAAGGVPFVIRTGRSVCVRRVTAEELALTGPDGAPLPIGRDRLQSAMIVPLRTASSVYGAISFVSTQASGREYRDADLALAEEASARAGIAIENARLYQIAQDANRQKDEFLATLSHELRTPLNAVLGWARMLESGQVPPERARQAIATIRRNAEAQARLIADILDVARIISGKLQLDLQQVDVSRLVASAIESCEADAQLKSIAVTTSIEPDVVSIVDPARLQQIVWNLMSNAIKFTPTGGRVAAALRREDDGLVCEVSDNGAGIDPGFLPHLFERFRQADPSTTRSHAGLGLGLAITRHLAELHGGSVTAASDGAGTGSTFTVRLPSTASVPGPEHAASRRRVPAATAHALRGRRLLVVDDDPDARQLLAVMLGDAGAEVETAESTRAALTHLARDDWDLLIADIAMPGEDGFELLHRVRAMGTDASRLPAIAVTAHARDDDRRRALLAGFQGHLPKPVDQQALIELAASALRSIEA